ncbi:hypothetical protein SPTER_15180 [Sporomusa termitida]|uniref:Uncharacterized protein n=1 Tax=Sporomusa termitida TaxID=2377 RepID=A0A517DS64_9FIRM|nr:hypothetical protein SPTER_15180 [Sporomusa termitida]
MAVTRAVPGNRRHIHSARGDRMEPKYAATYKFGKSTVHVVAPPPMSEEQKELVLVNLHKAAWTAWNSLPVEERLKINLGVDLTKILQRRLLMLMAE